MEKRLSKTEKEVSEIKGILSDEMTQIIGLRKELNGSLGKISDHMKTDERFKERVEPMLKKYEAEKAFNDEAQYYGKRAIFWAKVIGSIGVIVVAAKLGITQLLTYKP